MRRSAFTRSRLINSHITARGKNESLRLCNFSSGFAQRLWTPIQRGETQPRLGVGCRWIGCRSPCCAGLRNESVMSEITQIVRRQKRGEMLPVYSTAHLLMRVPVVAPTRSVAKITPEEKANLFTKNYELIKEMLGRFAPNSEIAEAIGVPLRYINGHIRSTEELICLSDARFKVVKQKGGHVGRKKSRDRFEKQKSEILRALETDAMHKVATKFCFSQKTLKVYVDEVKNGK